MLKDREIVQALSFFPFYFCWSKTSVGSILCPNPHSTPLESN